MWHLGCEGVGRYNIGAICGNGFVVGSILQFLFYAELSIEIYRGSLQPCRMRLHMFPCWFAVCSSLLCSVPNLRAKFAILQGSNLTKISGL